MQGVENQINSDCGKVEIERKAVENTPFIKEWVEGKGWRLGIAEHRLTNWYETEKDLDKLIGKTNWDFLTGVILILLEKTLEYKKLENKIEEKQKK